MQTLTHSPSVETSTTIRGGRTLETEVRPSRLLHHRIEGETPESFFERVKRDTMFSSRRRVIAPRPEQEGSNTGAGHKTILSSYLERIGRSTSTNTSLHRILASQEDTRVKVQESYADRMEKIMLQRIIEDIYDDVLDLQRVVYVSSKSTGIPARQHLSSLNGGTGDSQDMYEKVVDELSEIREYIQILTMALGEIAKSSAGVSLLTAAGEDHLEDARRLACENRRAVGASGYGSATAFSADVAGFILD